MGEPAPSSASHAPQRAFGGLLPLLQREPARDEGSSRRWLCVYGRQSAGAPLAHVRVLVRSTADVCLVCHLEWRS